MLTFVKYRLGKCPGCRCKDLKGAVRLCQASYDFNDEYCCRGDGQNPEDGTFDLLGRFVVPTNKGLKKMREYNDL